MSIPSRTNSGIRNEDLFYRNHVVVYVEDRNDIVFWAQIIPNRIGERTPHFKPLGGKQELLKRVSQFSFDGGKSIVATDSDYDEILSTSVDHPRLLSTIAYSIENILACECRCTRLIRNYTQSPDVNFDTFREWADEFDRVTTNLLATEIHLLRTNRNPMPPSPSHGRFRNSDRPGWLEANGIAEFVSSMGLNDRTLAETRASLVRFLPRHYYRGHFFLGAFSDYLRSLDPSKGGNRRLSEVAVYCTLGTLDPTCAAWVTQLRSKADKAAKAVES